MNRRNLLLLGGAAILSAGGALLLSQDRDGTPGSAAPGVGGLVFPGLAQRLAGAARIEITKPDSTLVVQREGDRWVLPQKGGYPVRPERVRELLVGLTELKLIEPRTADPAQHARLGLDDPATAGSSALLLRVLDGAGAPIAALIAGRRRVRTQGNLPESVYVRRPGEAQTWLAEGRLPVDADPQLWLDRDIANLPSARIRRLVARRDGAEPVELERPEGEPEAPFAVVAPPGVEGPLDDIALDEIGRAFEFLTFLDVTRAAEIPGTALGEASFTLTEGLGIAVTPHKDGENLWIRLAATGETEEARRLGARWQGWAYLVGPWKEKAFLPRPEDLRAREGMAPPAPEPTADLPPGHPALPGLIPGSPR